MHARTATCRWSGCSCKAAATATTVTVTAERHRRCICPEKWELPAGAGAEVDAAACSRLAVRRLAVHLRLIRLVRRLVVVVLAVVVRALVAVVALVVRVGLVVTRLPDPFVAAPLPLAGNPVVAVHLRVALCVDRRALVVVVVAVLDRRAANVDAVA